MNNIKAIVLISILFLKFSFVNSQENENYFASSNNIALQQLIGEAYLDPIFTNKGIYLNENFLPGKITFNTFDSISNLKLRYNCHTDQVIWLSKIHGQVELDKSVIKEFEIFNADTVFRFRQIKLSNDSASHFYQICYEGKVQLYVQRKASHYTNYIKDKKTYYIYKPNPQFYLLVNGNVFFLSNLNVKALYLFFPQLQEKIHQRVKELHINIRKESDFFTLVAKIEDILVEAR